MPASSADLAARPSQDVGFVLFFEGLKFAYTNRIELAGGGDGSWIGTGEGAGRVVLPGLELPDSIRHSISIEAGLVADNDVTFTILDHDLEFIKLLDSTEAEETGERLAPTDDPAPANIVSSTGGAVALHGRYVGGESIGLDGQRRQYQVLPIGAGGSMPGYDHAAITTNEQYLCPVEVADEARWFEGRRMSLYLIRRDQNTGEWVTWLDAETSSYGRIWWGTARRVSVLGRAWSVNCDGPAGWLRGSLNRLRPANWAKVTSAGLGISEAEGYCAIAFRQLGIDLHERIECGSSYFAPSDAIFNVGDSPEQVRSSLKARLALIANAAGPDGTFADLRNGTIEVEKDQDGTVIIMRVDQDPGGSIGGELWLVLHERVWRWLGFNPQEQSAELGQVQSEHELPFRSLPEGQPWTPGEPAWNGNPGAAPPTAGYFAARITTCAIGADFNNLECDSDGAARYHRSLNPQGVISLNEGSRLALVSSDSPYVGPQTMRPVDDVEVGGAPCDATGFIALRGSFRPVDPAAEVITLTTIWKASWKNVSGHFGDGAPGVGTVYLGKQLDPAPFGIKTGKLSPDLDWAVVDLEWTSVAIFGHNLTSVDRAHGVLLRIMLGSGTAAWTGYEGDPAAELTPGANGHPDAALTSIGNDLEVADLGLGVPAAMIDWKSFNTEAAALPLGGYNSEINKCRIGRIGPVDGGELIKALVHPRGWCIGLSGGKYSLFSKSRPIDVANSIASLTQSDLDSDDIPYIEGVDLNPLDPFDILTCSYGQDPIGGGSDLVLTGQPRDAGAMRRNGGAEMNVDGSTLIPGTNADSPPWAAAFRQIWEKDLAKFFASPHVVIEVPVRIDKARDIWPGSIVRFGSPWPASREGVYGLFGRVGRVISTTQDLRKALTRQVRILVQAGDPLKLRRFAPIAAVLDVVDTLEERHDAASRTFFCYDDAFMHGGASRDVAGFEEPEWLAVGGDAKCVGWQHDGRGWSQTFGFTLESVNVAGGSLTYKPGSLTGKFWERRWTFIVFAPYDDQPEDSWVRAIFGVICRPSGLFGADDTKGWKFK